MLHTAVVGAVAGTSALLRRFRWRVVLLGDGLAPHLRPQGGEMTGSDSQDLADDTSVLTYRLCPRCAMAVPSHTAERYCINDDTLLLGACPACRPVITSPYSRYCAGCGQAFLESLT